jgi:hypothetical protein
VSHALLERHGRLLCACTLAYAPTILFI